MAAVAEEAPPPARADRGPGPRARLAIAILIAATSVLAGFATWRSDVADRARSDALNTADVQARQRPGAILETLTSVLRYQSAQPTPAYRASLARLRAAWAHTDIQQRSQEMVRAIEGTQELEEQDPRLAAKARSYRADLQRIQKELSQP